MRHRWTVILLALGLLGMAWSAPAQPGRPSIHIEPIPGADGVQPGGHIRLAFRVVLDAGWHVQAHEPAEPYLIPTVLNVNGLPEGLTVAATAYPEPELFRLQGTDEDLLVYGHEFVVGAELAAAEEIAPGEYTVTGFLRYQACDDTTCIAPANEPFEIALTVLAPDQAPAVQNAAVIDAIQWPAPAATDSAGEQWLEFTARGGPTLELLPITRSDGVHPGDRLYGAVAVRLDEQWHVNAHEPLDDYLIPTALSFPDLPGGVELGGVAYPAPKTITLSFSPDPLAVYEHEFVIGFALDVPEGLAPGAYEAQAALRYQACDDKACWAPATASFTVPFEVVAKGTPIASRPSPYFDDISFDGLEAAAPDSAVAVTEPGVLAEGDWETLLSRFDVAGQASGMMNAADFIAFVDAAEAGEGSTQSLIGRGIWFVVFVALVGGLGLNLTPCVLPLVPINLAIIGAGARAGSKTRGFLLGGTYGLGIALVFGGLGLIFVLGLTSFGGNINASPWFNAFIAVLFVLLGIAMFGVYNFDLSKLQAKIHTVGKQGTFAFAFFMGSISAVLAGACVAPALAAVLLYSQDLYAKNNPLGLILPFLVAAGMALPWPIAGAGISVLPKPGKWMDMVKYAFGVFIVGLGIYYGALSYQLFAQRWVDESEVIASVEESGWQTSFTAGLQQAAAEQKPVLIDFWATWCKNCLVMNNTTFKDETVLARLDDYVKIKYQAEDPSAAPHASILAQFDQYVSFPFYVVLTPR